jgi:hypothetical protein
MAGFFLAARHVHIAGIVVPGGNPMPPPELARDAPVLDVPHPVPIGADPVRRHELHRTALHQFQPARGELLHPHEPLVGEIGLDHLSGAIAARHLQLVLLLLDQQARGFQIRKNDLSSLVAIQSPDVCRDQVDVVGEPKVP